MKTTKEQIESTSLEREAIEKALIGGDLSDLTPEARVGLYREVCTSLGLNPYTQPFEYLLLPVPGQDRKKLVLYARKDCTEQLRKIHSISVHKLERTIENGLICVRTPVSLPNGRTDEAIGAVAIERQVKQWDQQTRKMKAVYKDGQPVWENLRGDDLANAMMKAETKSKRRATLSIAGLGMIDESEIETIKGAEVVSVQAAHATTEPIVTPAPVQAALEHKEPLAMDLGGVREAVQVGASDSLQEKNGKMVYTLKGTKPEAEPQKPLIRGNPWMHVMQKGQMAGSPLSDFEPDTIRKALRSKRVLATLTDSDIAHMQAALDAYDNETPPDPVEPEFIHLSLDEDDVIAGQQNGGAQ